MESVLIAINTFIFELEFKIMKKLNKTGLALGVALAVASTGAFAGTFSPITSETVGVEASTTGSLVADIDGNFIKLTPNGAAGVSDRVFITLDNGATFADSTYSLSASDGAKDLDASLVAFTLVTPEPAGASTLEFRVASELTTANQFVLSGSNVASQAVSINVPALSAGATLSIDANAEDNNGIYDFYTAAVLFGAANQFSASPDEIVASGIVDVNDSRLSLVGGTDRIALNFTEALNDNGVPLNADDSVDIVLSGDMTGVAAIAFGTGAGPTNQGNFTIDANAGTATFTAEASDLFIGGGNTTSGVLDITTTGSASLATRTFTVQADLDFETETDKNLIAAGAAAGSWTINGLQAKVAHLSLNVSGFISWLKVVNEGTAAAEITSDIIWTLADGTEGSVRNADLGSVDAGGVFTVSEAAILTAIGSPTQVADVSMTVTVAGQTNLVHLTAEKKASDGRTTLPVYYNTGAGRDWVQ